MAEISIGVSRLLSSGYPQGAGSGQPGVLPKNTLVEEVLTYQKRLERVRHNQDSIWDDTDNYVISRRSHYNVGYIRGDSPNDQGGTQIYDDAATDAIQKFSDNFQAQSATPLIDWYMARFRGPLKDDSRSMKWLDETKEIVRYELSRSAFYEVYNECVQDAVSHGIATMGGPEWTWEKDRLEFQDYHPREIFCTFDLAGRPTRWHQKFPITGRQILAEFPDAKLSEVMRNKIKENPFREFMCVHAIFKRSERDLRSVAATDKEWASVWCVETEKVLLKESGYDEFDMPMDTWIWRKGSNGLYCFSMASDAIYTVILENDSAKSLLKSTQLSLEPPLLITEGVKGNVNFFPAGQTVLKTPADKVQAFQFPTNFGISVEAVNDLRDRLNKRFRADIFGMMADLPAGTKAFTASQVAGEKASGLIPVVTRSSSQMLIPKLDKTVHSLARAGRLPPPPKTMMRYAKSPVDIEMTGPVATAAKRFLSQRGFNDMMAQLQEIGAVTQATPQFMQTLLEGFNPDKVRAFLIDSNSVTRSLLFEDEELAAIRQKRMKMAQQQRQMQMMQEFAKASKEGGNAPEQGSLADMAIKGGR